MAFPRRYSDEQKAAIVWAVLDRDPRLSCPKAVAAAQAGELGLPAFTIPKTTAQSIMRDEKHRRLVDDNAPGSGRTPVDVLEDAAGVLAGMVALRTGRARRRKSTTSAEIAEIAKAGREVAAMVRALKDPKPPGPKGKQDTTPDTDENPPSFLAQVAANNAKPDPSSPTPSPSTAVDPEGTTAGDDTPPTPDVPNTASSGTGFLSVRADARGSEVGSGDGSAGAAVEG